MAVSPTTSLDAALNYATNRVGHKKAAELLRAAAFDDTIRDERTLRPQLASALVRAVERYRTELA